MQKVVVLAPGNFAPSGGPEALHQLVSMCNEVSDGSAAILYEPENYTGTSVYPYKNYQCPEIKRKDIGTNSLVVIPEVWPHLAKTFDNPTALWWLSVDFFSQSNLDYINDFSLHLTQSFYAETFLKNKKVDSIMLTDYINDIYNQENNFNKKEYICVNPAKGKSMIDHFRSLNKDLNIIELTQMTKEKVKQTMDESMIYIDFGHHPGRDRMPREAALSNTIVLTTKKGAASNNIDIPIDDWYKFNEIDQLREKINSIFNNYKLHKDVQKKYRNVVLNQKNIFKVEVENLLKVATNANYRK